jgi:hypothetical protein
MTVGRWYIPTPRVTNVQARTRREILDCITRRHQIMEKMQVREKCKSLQSHTSELDLLRRTTTPLPQYQFLWLSHRFLAFSISHNHECFVSTQVFPPLFIDAMKTKRLLSNFHCCCVTNNSN